MVAAGGQGDDRAEEVAPRSDVPPGLAQVRAEIDRIDARLVALLARRQEQVRLAAAHKDDQAAVRAADRQAQVRAAARARAVDAGLDVDVADRVWRAMVAGFEDLELRLHGTEEHPAT